METPEQGTTLPPEEPGRVLEVHQYLYRLHNIKGRLERLKHFFPADDAKAVTQFANLARRHVSTTYQHHMGASTPDETLWWGIQERNLANLLDEMRPLEDLDKRITEWLKMIDEMIEATEGEQNQ